MRLILGLSLLLLVACSSENNNTVDSDIDLHSRGVYLLIDTSGTYTEELIKAQQIINYLLVMLEPGDSFAVARIDSGSFSEQDIVAKTSFDERPSVANRQKREFAAIIDHFVKTVKSSAYTDISGGLLQAVEFLEEAKVGQQHIFIFSDLKEELPKGFVRDMPIDFEGISVKALNVTKLRSDNQNPQEYLDRVQSWQTRIESGKGSWMVVNDLDRGLEL